MIMKVSIWQTLNPKVPNRVLLFVASFVWGFASMKILFIGIAVFRSTAMHLWLILLFSVPVFLLFHFFVFGKIILKHTSRIIGKSSA